MMIRALALALLCLCFAAVSARAQGSPHAFAGDKPIWTEADLQKLKSSGERVPAYVTETWDAPRQTAVWAKPGQSGDIADPKNWLVDGKTPDELTFTGGANDKGAFDLETDLVFPPADKPYTVSYKERGRGGLFARHVSVGKNANITGSVLRVAGNIHVGETGRLHSRYMFVLTGDKHTVFVNDKPHYTAEKRNTLPPGDGTAKYDSQMGYMTAQYMNVEKKGDASVEFVGSLMTSDDWQLISGRAIVAPNAQLMPGTRSTQKIAKGATLELHSGSHFYKAHNSPWYDQDMVVEGTIQAGTADHPITQDAVLGISFKDKDAFDPPKGTVDTKRAAPGLVFRPGAEVKVFTADPKKAQLVIAWHGRESTWYLQAKGEQKNGKPMSELYKSFPRVIDVVIEGDLALENVRFDHVREGGIRLADPSIRAKWKNVTFGEHNAAKGDDLFAAAR